MRRILVVLASLVLVLGACSSGGDETTEATDDAAADNDSDPGDGAAQDGDDPGDGNNGGAGEDEDQDDGEAGDGGGETDAQDQARLDGALSSIESEARGLGYDVTLTDPDDDDGDDDLDFESEACEEADRVFNELEDEIGETAQSQSLDATRGEFSSPDSTIEQLSVELSSTPTQDDVARGFEALGSVPLDVCLQEAFESSAGDDGVEIENVRIDVSDDDRGDRSIVMTMQADFTTQGFPLPADILFSFVAVDRDVLLFSAVTINGSVTADATGLLDFAVSTIG